MVYNKVPFLATSVDNSTLIDEYTAEVFAELHTPFEVAVDDMMDETKYNPLQRSMTSDMVAVYLLKRKILINQEGTNGGAATGTKILVKAKAGEAEAEWDSLKGTDASRLLMTANDLLKNLMMDAGRKANQMMFSLDMRIDGQWVLESLSLPLPMMNVPFTDC